MLLLFYPPQTCRNKSFCYYLKQPFYTFDNCHEFSKIEDWFFCLSLQVMFLHAPISFLQDWWPPSLCAELETLFPSEEFDSGKKITLQHIPTVVIVSLLVWYWSAMFTWAIPQSCAQWTAPYSAFLLLITLPKYRNLHLVLSKLFCNWFLT